METAFLLPLPKFRGPRLLIDDAQIWKEKGTLSLWNEKLDKLVKNKNLWAEIMRELTNDERPSLHPLVGLASTTKESQTLLHLAVLDDRHDCIALIGSNKRALERRNFLGISPLDLALFLHKTKSAQVLSQKPPENITFLQQPRVEFSDPKRIEDLGLEYLAQPIFESLESLEEVFTSSIQAKNHNLIPHDRIWMGIYYDKEIQTGKHPPVAVRWIDDDLGFGVFARQRIMPCSYVGEYTGLIQRRKRQHALVSNYAFRHTSWQMGRHSYVIEAEKMGNFTRFINHSDEPNLGFVCAYWCGMPRLLLVSLQTIPEGTQLSVDYGKLFWEQSPHILKREL